MSNAALKARVIKLVENLLYARRIGIKAETAAHRKLMAFCEQHNIDSENCITGATRWIKANRIAPSMNGAI